MTRTDYRDVARDLAKALNMNYAYGVEFLEIDPLNLGEEKVEMADKEARPKFRSRLTWTSHGILGCMEPQY